MGARHPLPYAFAKANTLLLEDDGAQLVLWAAETTPPAALSEVTRLFDVTGFEREASSTLVSRIAVAYAGGESSAAAVIGEVESGVDRQAEPMIRRARNGGHRSHRPLIPDDALPHLRGPTGDRCRLIPGHEQVALIRVWPVAAPVGVRQVVTLGDTLGVERTPTAGSYRVEEALRPDLLQ